MMRWLKDKKRNEKKQDDPYKEEDDYGFEKEKTPNKSPVIKRQLPPTPAAPEEKSTHIYEEIPDLHVSSTAAEHERISSSKNKKQGKSKATTINGNPPQKNRGVASSGVDNSCLDDSISPYMVVPVDEEVRQTPPHFHRNGTPEVHCDLIVKDTHCEILWTRKPKVGAFRLDSTTGSENGVSNATANISAVSASGIRNNTHFCSLNRRASVDVQTGGGAEGGKGASAFSWSSSAFSSASTSRVNSMGTSTMSLSTLPEHNHSYHHHPHHIHGQTQPMTLTEGDSAGSNGSSAKGVMTYSTASNFIPRATKLVFKPLTPLDPDFFDAPDQSLMGLMNSDNAALQEQQQQQQQQSALHVPLTDDDASIKYASVQGLEKPETDSPVEYSAIQSDQLYDANQTPMSQTQLRRQQQHQQCRPASPPSLADIRQSCPATLSDNPLFRSSLIRPYSPSSSSSCTYASVNFPQESRHYNTIQGLDLPEPSTNSLPLSPPPLHPLNSESEPSMIHSSIQGEACSSEKSFSRPTFPSKYNGGDFQGESSMFEEGHGHKSHGTDASHQCSKFSAIQYSDSSNTTVGNRASHGYHGASSEAAIYSGIVTDFNSDTTYACIDAKDEQSATTNHTTSSLLQNKMDGRLVLDFCTCHDYQQYSSCGCSDINVKAGDDDDNASVATTTNEAPKSSCSGCGRLIRQITYSESYSDETYEHAYSSRLLLRRGRRFSSPDITMSEISNSESQDLRLRQGGSPFGSTMSRDDMWSISRDDRWSLPQSQNCDVRSTFYRPDGDTDASALSTEQQQYPSSDHPVVLNGSRDQRPSTGFANASNNIIGQRLVNHRKSLCAFDLNDKELGALNSQAGFSKTPPGGHQQIKKTPLPLNSKPTSPLVTSEPKSGRTSAMAQLQPKSSAFSGLFSKFSRPKTKPPAVKVGDDGIESQNTNSLTASNGNENHGKMGESSTNSKLNSSVGHIPEKNTLKLSKLFNRMSSKETFCEPQSFKPTHPDSSDWKNMTGLRVDLDNSTQKSIPSQQDRCPQNQYTTIPHNVSSAADSSFDITETITKSFPSKVSNNNSNDSGSKNNTIFDKRGKSKFNDKCIDDAIKSKSYIDVASDIGSTQISASNNAKLSAVSSDEQQLHGGSFLSASEANGKGKAQNKTDSGDTCYEYDISTSSESEHTSYDYFLSKVKKSLNLEKEVQHIADMNALRKKLLCKLCKKGATMQEQCNMCGVDGTCTHISSLKCSDWRKFFGELVVDQRAAILDCLTDFTHSPFTVKGDCSAADNSSHCRECGGEIMTSDSESLTTVYSLLSQHLRMTSPVGAHTPSCDSDEGTMADNSGESGDEDKRGHHGEVGGDSSGFDDDEGCGAYGHVDHNRSSVGSGDRTRRRDKSSSKDKREKKEHSHSNPSLSGSSRRKSLQSSLTHDTALAMEENFTPTSSTAENLAITKSGSSHHKHIASIKRHSNTSNKNQKIGGSPLYYNPTDQPKSSPILSSYSLDNLTGTQKSSSASGSKDMSDADTNAGLDMARAKTSLLATDRAIQDIYAPLPSKALSWLTTRSTPTRTNQCACSRVSPSASYGSLPKASGSDVVPMAPVQNRASDSEENKNSRKEGTTTNILSQGKTSTEILIGKEKLEEVSSKPKTEQAAENTQISVKNLPKIDAKINSSQGSQKQITPDVCQANKNSCSESKTDNIETAMPMSEACKPQQKPEPNQSPVMNLGRRRSRQLSLAALDLLPETAFGSDVVEEEEGKKGGIHDQKENTKPTSRHDNSQCDLTSSPCKKTPPRTRLVERMARLFESNDSTNPQGKDISINDHSKVTNVTTTPILNKLSADGNISGKREVKSLPKKFSTGSGTSEDVTNENKESTQPQAKSKAQARALIAQRIEQKAAAATDKTVVSSKMLDKTAALNVNNSEKLPVSVRPRRRSSSVKSDTNHRSRSRTSSLHRPAAPPSPSLSSSSLSSSSSFSRRRGGAGIGTKQKRLAKKAQLNKKIKNKGAEQRKKKKKRDAGKHEEKTYYCLSSDISDIDVVEVDDWDTYSSGQRPVSESSSRHHHAHSHSCSNSKSNTHHHHSNSTQHHDSIKEHHHKSRRERSLSRSREGKTGISSNGGKSRSKHMAKDRMRSGISRGANLEVSKVDETDDSNDDNHDNDKNDNDSDNQELVQEVYSMPPNSSEVCEVKGHHRDDTPTSPTASPELSKLRGKSKRTDIYKTKKSNNRLLSDLIIRNYDRQVFGNV